MVGALGIVHQWPDGITHIVCSLGFLYLLFTTFPTLFQETYHWGAGVNGLAYLGMGIGFLTAAILGGTTMNSLYFKVSDILPDSVLAPQA